MELILKFTDQSQSFSAGVEFGRLLEQMQRGDENIKSGRFPVRLSNQQMIIDGCKVYGYAPAFGPESFGEWIEFVGIKKTYSQN